MNPTTLAEQLFFATVRIDTRDGEGNSSSGTGFVFSHTIDGITIPILVTNKHVIEGDVIGKITFLRSKNNDPAAGPELGDGVELQIEPKDWVEMWDGHPDADVDIAVCPFLPLAFHIRDQLGIQIFYRAVASTLIPTAEQEKALDAIEPVTFIGYPNGIWDKVNKLPVARRGTTASPIRVDFEGTPRFLIDASVFGGSSGSPVFILDHGPARTPDGGTMIGGSRFLFVGVVAAVFFRVGVNEVIPVPIPTQHLAISKHEEMLDLGIVFKASTVVEAIEAAAKAKGVFRVD